MKEKRYFLLGFILGKLSAEDVPYEKWHEMIYRFAEKMAMSKPTREEMRDIGEFMTYVNDLYQAKHPNDGT